MNSEHVVILITAPNKDAATKISKTLLESKMAACVNIISSIHSLYTWEGKINQDEEVLLMIKTRRDLFDEQFINVVKTVHPYDVPEIIALPIIAGSNDYLEWIDDVTAK